MLQKSREKLLRYIKRELWPTALNWNFGSRSFLAAAAVS
jgi:hypothetical protein